MDRQVFERMGELGDRHWWFYARRQILESVISRVINPPRNSQILEIGAGTGHNFPMLGKFGQVTACELDEEARAVASARLGQPVVEVALPDLSMFPPAHFDLIALLDVLEHVEDDAASLASIRERLKPGGSLLLTVPANRWMWSAHDVAHHHHRRYQRREIVGLASKAGLELTLLTHFNTILFPLIAGVRIAGRLTKQETADDMMPPRPINAILSSLFGSERHLIGRIPLPFGVSLLGVLRRPV